MVSGTAELQWVQDLWKNWEKVAAVKKDEVLLRLTVAAKRILGDMKVLVSRSWNGHYLRSSMIITQLD